MGHIIDHTAGGASVYPPSRNRTRTKAKANPRYLCSCGHKTTRGQLRNNGFICQKCKTLLSAKVLTPADRLYAIREIIEQSSMNEAAVLLEMARIYSYAVGSPYMFIRRVKPVQIGNP